MGRPSKYDPVYAAQLVEFFNVEAFEERTIAEGTPREKIQLVPTKFPTLQRFAVTIGVHPETLLNWANAKDEDGERRKHPEFFDAYTHAKALQESLLIEGAMAGTYNAQFSQFAAINLFNWRSKHEVTGADGKDLIPKGPSWEEMSRNERIEVAKRIVFLLKKAELEADGKSSIPGRVDRPA